MAGRIFITGNGIDPGIGDTLTDPVFAPVPCLGACMPNIRRVVSVGDWLFVISGRKENVAQYIVGGFQVAEKISALQAYRRYPDLRLRRGENGFIAGNIPVDRLGAKHPLDQHSERNFDRRAQNFIVGKNAVTLESEGEVAASRRGTLNLLGDVFARQGNRPIDIIGRSRSMTDDQANAIVDFLRSLKNP